jgi:hypothetical protein
MLEGEKETNKHDRKERERDLIEPKREEKQTTERAQT